MGKAVFPARLGDVMFDAVISRKRTYSAEIPEYAVETGFKVSDAVLKSPLIIDVTAFVSNTPVSWKNTLSGASYTQGDSKNKYSNRLETTVKKLESMYFSGNLFNFEYCGKTYTNMAIQSITVPEEADMLNAAEIEIVLKKVVLAKSQTTFIEEDYEEGGSSYADAGEQDTGETILEGQTIDRDDNTELNFCLMTFLDRIPNPDLTGIYKSDWQPAEISVDVQSVTAYEIVKIIVGFIGYKLVMSESAKKKLKNNKIFSFKSDEGLYINYATVSTGEKSYYIAGSGAGTKTSLQTIKLSNETVKYFITDKNIDIWDEEDYNTKRPSDMKSAFSLLNTIGNSIGGISVVPKNAERKITINSFS